MSDAGWYARRLAQQAPAQPQQQTRAWSPGTYTPQPQAFQPAGVGGQPQYNPYQTVPGQHQQPPQPPPPGSVTHDNFMQMAGQWRGGPAMRAEPNNCPECGSPRFYSRSKTVSRGPAPAPHCFDCGFSGGLFTQGDPTVWGAS